MISMLKHRLLGVGFVLLCLMGCNLQTPQNAPTLETVLPTPSPSYSPLPTPTAQPMPQLINLRLWIPDFLDPYAESADADSIDDASVSDRSVNVDPMDTALLLSQLEAFNEIYPDVQVQVIVKKATGHGGLYRLFSTAYVAAPDVLPDLIMLSHDDLQLAITHKLILPLENVVLATDDFFPFALESVTRNEKIYAMPLFMDVDQMVYRSGVSATPPFSWTDVLTKGYSILFPAAPQNDYADDALLAAYLSVDGAISADDILAPLNPKALELVYQFFNDLLTRSLLNPERALALADATACWETYQQGIGRLSPVPMGVYWSSASDYGFPGWMPTPSGDPVLITHPWALTTVTTDTVRREAALQLALWLTSPQPMGDIARSADLMPMRLSALDQWALLPEDKAFIAYMLSDAYVSLSSERDLAIRQALQAGLFALLNRDVTTPEEAAAYALANWHE